MGTGVGEAMLISAAVGAGTGAAGSAISGGDPLKGALTGAAMGAVSGGIGSSLGGAGALTGTASESALNAQIANEAALGFNAVPSATPTGFGVIPPDAGLASITPPPASPMANPLINANGEMSEGIAALNNVASQNPVAPFNPSTPSTTPTYQYEGVKGNLAGSTNAPANPASPSPHKFLPDYGYRGATPNVFEYGPQSNAALAMTGATSGIAGATQAERGKYGMPSKDTYDGPLTRFKYDPNTYNPDVVRPPNPIYKPVYAAEGGIMSLAPNGMAMGGVTTRPPQTNFANPQVSEMGTSQYSMATDPMSGNIANRMAAGGITSLGSYSDGGRMLKGPGDGMSDDIPAMIGKKQPARLADGEFVIPADVVSHLGNGSTDAGAKKLYSMMGKVRKARVGTKKQGKQINPDKYLYA